MNYRYKRGEGGGGRMEWPQSTRRSQFTAINLQCFNDFEHMGLWEKIQNNKIVIYVKYPLYNLCNVKRL
jgi:hypothetical protein